MNLAHAWTRTRLLRSIVLASAIAVLPFASASASAEGEPCQLLSATQVATALSKSDKGFTTQRGRSLLRGVRNFQCTYTNPDLHMLLVLVEVAADANALDAIKPAYSKAFLRESGATQPGIGEASWLFRAPDGALRLKIVQGMKVIELALETPDARQRADALVDLGKAVAAKVK